MLVKQGSVSRFSPRLLAYASTMSEALWRVVEWMVYVIVAILPVDVYFSLPGRSAGVFLSEVLVVETILIAGCLYLLHRLLKLPGGLGLRWLDAAPLGLIVIAGLISTLGAAHKGDALRDCAKYAFYLGVYILARIIATRPFARRRALISVVLGFGLVVGLGLLFSVPGLPNIPQMVLNIQQVPSYLPGSSSVRAASTFRYSDELEGYLLLTLPIIVVCTVRSWTWFERIGYGLLTIAGIWLLLLTYTRSAYLVMLVIFPLLLYFLAGDRLGEIDWTRLAVIGAVIGALAGAGVMVGDHRAAARILSLLSGADSGYSNRLAVWRWAMGGFLHHPLFGLGPRHLAYLSNAPLADPYHNRVENNAENSYLNVLVDMGILGAAALLVAVAAAVRHIFNAVRQHGDWYDNAWNIGAFVGTIAILLDAVVHPTFYSAQVTGLLCCMVGLTGGVWERPAIYEPSPRATVKTTMPPDTITTQSALSDPSPDSAISSTPVASGAPLALKSRIVFLLNSASIGGAQLVSLHLASALQQQGIDVLIVCPPRAHALIERVKSFGLPLRALNMGVSVGRWHGWLGTLLFFLPLSDGPFNHLIDELAAERSSMFVAPFLREQLLLARLSRRLDIRVIWALHSPLHYLPHRLFLRSLQRSLARDASAIIAISHSQADEWIKSGLPSSRLHMVRNGIPDTFFAAPQRSHSHPVHGSVYRIGFISRLTEGKGAQFLIQALPRVLERFPNTAVGIAGTGRYENHLRRLVARLGLRRHVKFLGFVADVSQLLQTVDLVALPTVDSGEVTPTILLEASAAGVPIIASDLPGIREAVVPDQTGILITPGNVDELAHAIIRALSGPQATERMAAEGRAHTQTHYALPHTAAQFSAMLRELELMPDEPGDELASTSSVVRVVHRTRFVKQSALFLVSKTLTAAATAVWTILAAGALTKTAYGDLMLGVGMLDILAPATDAGVTTIATRDAAQAPPSELSALSGAVLLIKVALGIGATLLTLAVAIVAPFTAEARYLLALLAPSLVFSALSSLALLFRARSLLWHIVVVACFVSIASIAVTVVAALNGANVTVFALIELGVTTASGVLTLILMLVHFRPRLLPDIRRMKRLIVAALPYGVSLALVYLYYRIDIPLLAVLGGVNQVAVYTSAYRILDVITLLPAAASGIALAEMAKLAKEPNRKYLVQFSQQYLEMALVIGLLIVVFLSVAGREILRLLYSGRYDDSYSTLYILAWAAAATLLTNVFLPLVNALDQRRVIIGAGVVALVVNIGINLVLIPILGPVGAATATLCTEIAVTACYAFVAVRQLQWRLQWKVAAAAALATISALGAQQITTGLAMPGWLVAVISLAGWVAVFSALAPRWIRDLALTRESLARNSENTTPESERERELARLEAERLS